MCAPSLRTSTLNPALPSPRSKTLDDVRAKLENFDQKIGVQIIQNALRVPMKTIASNAGVEGAVIVGKVREGRLGLSSRGRGGGAGRGAQGADEDHRVKRRCRGCSHCWEGV